MQTFVVETASQEQTRTIGELIGKTVQGGTILALCGDLGAGKTTLVQGIAAGMGIRDRVTSPTFVLVSEYTADDGRRLVHVDTYRLGEEHALAEASTFGLADLVDINETDANGVVAIEWADRVWSIVPEDALHITFVADPDHPDHRMIEIGAMSGHGAALLATLVPILETAQTTDVLPG